MSTTIKPEISSKNRYWLDRHRYYELKHFCLQYKIWNAIYRRVLYDGSNSCNKEVVKHCLEFNDPTCSKAEILSLYSDRMEMVEYAAKSADKDLFRYIIIGVTEGLSFDKIKAKYNVPCSRELYYDRYRRFFWLLSQIRK